MLARGQPALFVEVPRSMGFSEVGLLGRSQVVLCLDSIPKIQNGLRFAFTLYWAMVAERCASSGAQGKHIVLRHARVGDRHHPRPRCVRSSVRRSYCLVCTSRTSKPSIQVHREKGRMIRTTVRGWDLYDGLTQPPLAIAATERVEDGTLQRVVLVGEGEVLCPVSSSPALGWPSP
jgi:hypothetical protein